MEHTSTVQVIYIAASYRVQFIPIAMLTLRYNTINYCPASYVHSKTKTLCMVGPIAVVMFWLVFKKSANCYANTRTQNNFSTTYILLCDDTNSHGWLQCFTVMSRLVASLVENWARDSFSLSQITNTVTCKNNLHGLAICWATSEGTCMERSLLRIPEQRGNISHAYTS